MTMLALTLLAGCNSYELFRLTGFEQATFSNDADILFIIDNSDSMQEEATALATNMNVFINKLTSAEGSNAPTATLSDAVDNYLRETTGGTLLIDYQLAITTSSVYYDDGPTSDIDPGEAGTFAYDSTSDVGALVKRGQGDAAADFNTNLLCEATCWDQNMPSNPDYVCGDALEGDVSEEYLDCLCGVGEWTGNCGTGMEQPIEAALMTLCRTVENPPDDCYLFPSTSAIAFQTGDEQSNESFLREGANTLVVIVSDEGDSSLRHDEHEPGEDNYDPAVPGDVETVVDEYLDILEQFPNVVRFAVIGPAFDGTDGGCLDGAQEWGVERYQYIAAETNGLYIPLTDIENDCAATDFATNLEDLGQLLSNLQTIFPLQSIPDESTIEVYVDGEQLERSEVTGEGVDVVYGNGWTYDASENAVSFHGDSIPDYNQDVRIYYRPLGGMPRELPF